MTCHPGDECYAIPMTEKVARILDEARQLSAGEREDLAERLVESLTHNIPADVEARQVSEVKRRIAEIDSGKVSVVSGEEAMRQIRHLVASTRAKGR